MRFTIRDVLWLIVVVGLGITLHSECLAMRREIAEQQSAIRLAEIDLETIAHVVLDRSEVKQADLELVKEIASNWRKDRYAEK
jgi:hypothetical protein